MTPIQQAIEYYRSQKTTIGKDRTLGKNSKQDAIEATESIISYLESLLEKEKEFALHCYREGIKVTDQSDFMDSHIIRNQYRHEFINQLYPKP